MTKPRPDRRFSFSRFADVSLNQWLALTPPALVAGDLNVGPDFICNLRKEKWPVVAYPGYSYFPKGPTRR